MKPARLEQALVAYLSSVGAPVSTRVPNPRPASFVRVTRTGGFRSNTGQSQPRILIECWGGSDSAAWALVEKTWPLIASSDEPDQIAPGVEVMSVDDLGEPVNFPDVSSGSPRYQFTAQLTVNLKE